SSGAYSFPFLYAGSYTLFFAAPAGYVSEWYDDAHGPGDANVITLYGGIDSAFTANASLAKTGGTGQWTVTNPVGGQATSLRHVLGLASASPGDDVVTLGTNQTYQLTCAAGGELHAFGQGLTIVGNGSKIVQTCAGERVLEADGSVALGLTGVTITG